MLEQTISERLKTIHKQLVHPQTGKRVHLVAVSKFHSYEKILEAIRSEQFDFGENYVQEAIDKIEKVNQSLGTELDRHLLTQIRWHFIGRIQTNKLKFIVGKFEYIHSVDRVEVLQKISQLAQQKNIIQKVFLQVNQGNEDSKGGFEEEFIIKNWSQISQYSNINIVGLMSLPPLFENAELTRPYFRSLKNLLQKLNNQSNESNSIKNEQSASSRAKHQLSELSMGTTHDYPIAIQEGSTYVRIGTAIFGERS